MTILTPLSPLLFPSSFFFFFLSSPYGSAARKRSAQDGVQGAPVNKRKSLLMKPRHYSPSDACEEESEDLAPSQDKEELRNIDTPAGKQMSCCFVCFDEQLTLNFKIPSVAFIFPLPLPSASSSSHCAVEVKDYTAGPILVVSLVHKLKFWQLICHDIFGVALPSLDEARFQTPHLSFFNSQPKPIDSIQ